MPFKPVLLILSLCFLASGQLTELTGLRDYYSKSFQGIGKNIITEVHSGPIHYNDKLMVAGGGYRNIDFTLKTQDSGWTFLENSFRPYLPKWSDSTARFRDLYSAKDLTVMWKPLCNHIAGRIITADELATERLQNLTAVNCICYDSAFGPGRDLLYVFDKTGMKIVVRFRAGYYPGADTVLRFGMTLPDSAFQCASPTVLANAVQKNTAKINLANAVTSLTVGNTVYIGRGNDAKEYTILRPFRIYENSTAFDRRDSLIPTSITSISGINYLNKTVHKAFFTGLTTDVFVNTNDGYYGSNDGLATCYDATSWANCQAGIGTLACDGTQYSLEARERSYSSGGTKYQCCRGFMTFVCSIPSADIISACSLYVFGYAYVATYSTCLYGSANYGVLAGTSYTYANTTAMSSNVYSSAGTAWNNNAYNVFVGNAAMIAAINLGAGVCSYFVLRGTYYDAGGNTPAGTTTYVATQGRTSASASTEYDPYIKIIHAPAATNKMPAFLRGPDFRTGADQ